MIICFLGFILAIAMLELFNELSSSPLIEVGMHHTKHWSNVCVKQNFEGLVLFVMSLTFTKFACITLVHWHVILMIMGKMAHKQLASNMQ